MKRVSRVLMAAAVVLVVALACQNTLSGASDPSVPWDPNLGMLRVSIGNAVSASSTIAPELDMSIVEYDIAVTGPGDRQEATVTANASTVHTFYSLEPGLWTVEVEGWNSADQDTRVQIGVGSGDQTVVAGQRETVSISVVPLTGPGSLSLSISWPEDLFDDPLVEAWLTPVAAGDAGFLEFQTGTDSASYSGQHEAGYYDLEIELLDNGSVAWARTFAVRIVFGQLSTRTFELSAGDITSGALDVEITANLDNPYSVSFSGFQSPITTSQDIEVGVLLVPETTPVQVRWYVNGELRETADTIDIGPAGVVLAAGSYWIDALVTVGNTVSSHGELLTVTD